MYRPLSRPLRRTLPGVSIVVLGKYPRVFNGFKDNCEAYCPGYNKVFVRDGNHIDMSEASHEWTCIQGPEIFSMADNANLGWKKVPEEDDILYVGDDVRFLYPNTVEHLRNIATYNPNIGLLSPKIVGGAYNPLQTNPPTDTELVYSDRSLALVCTYIKREIISKVGYLDDVTFKGYGWEDIDFCRRVKLAGYKLAITPTIEVQHGVSVLKDGSIRKGTETFIANEDGHYEPIQAQCDANEAAFLAKWGDTDK